MLRRTAPRRRGLSGSDWRGLFLLRGRYHEGVAGKVVVFLDYQNVYMGAREAFHLFGSPSQDGQVDPLKLAELIAAKEPVRP